MLSKLPRQSNTNNSPDTHRVGVIEVSSKLFEQELGITIDLADTQGTLRDKGIFEQVKKTFLLPESYSVHSIFTGPFRRTWLIAVESPTLTPVYDGEEAPRITPVYVRYADGRVKLAEIRVDKST